MLRFLWGTFLPSVGLLTIIVGPATAAWIWWDWHGQYLGDRDDYRIDWGVTAERRIPSPDGRKDLVIYSLNGATRAQAQIVLSGTEVVIAYSPSLSFEWLHGDGANDLPVDIAWVRDDLIRVVYCGIPISGQNSIANSLGYVDVEWVRKEGCDAQVQSSSFAPVRIVITQ